MPDSDASHKTRAILNSVARSAAAVLLLVLLYLASAPFVVVTARLRAPASQVNVIFYFYYLPALAYPGSEMPGSSLYEGYYDACARSTTRFWEPR